MIVSILTGSLQMRVVKQTSDAEITDSFSSEDEKVHLVHGKMKVVGLNM